MLFVVLLSVLNPLFATNQNAENELITSSSHVVYTVTGENSISISNGQLSATPGHSIRLLPGTHIGGEEKLTINIADKACQDAVAHEVKKESEAQMVETVVRRKQQSNSFTPVSGITLFCSAPLLPAQNGQVQSAHACSLAIPAPAQSNIVPSVIELAKQNNTLNTYQAQVSTLKTPVASRSWGEVPETIKILRC